MRRCAVQVLDGKKRMKPLGYGMVKVLSLIGGFSFKPNITWDDSWPGTFAAINGHYGPFLAYSGLFRTPPRLDSSPKAKTETGTQTNNFP
jgi:hypothetical protein